MNIFVAGVHGVGKSTLCSAYADSRSEEWVHRSASALIREELGMQDWSGDKRTASVETNQQLLVRAVKNSYLNNRRLLLDGHFILRDADNGFVPVSEEVFLKLNLAGVVLVEAEPTVVLSRLRTRDDAKWSLDQVTNFLKAERAQAERVCARLQLLLRVIVRPTMAEFSRTIDSFTWHSRA